MNGVDCAWAPLPNYKVLITKCAWQKQRNSEIEWPLGAFAFLGVRVVMGLAEEPLHVLLFIPPWRRPRLALQLAPSDAIGLSGCIHASPPIPRTGIGKPARNVPRIKREKETHNKGA